ncbi:hypothetical protein Tco_0169152 [Tanacetum coccineum]
MIFELKCIQYIPGHTDHNLWDVIVNGDLEEELAPTGETSTPLAPKTMLNHSRKQSNQGLEVMKNQEDAEKCSKHQFEILSTTSNESLDKAYDRFQKLISQLENQIALIMRNKPDIDEIDIDDLYKNLRVYEDEMKRYSDEESTPANDKFSKADGLITPIKQNEKRAVHKVSTARPVSTTRPVSIARPVSIVRPFAPKIAQTSGSIRPIYPRMDNVWRPKGNYLDHVSKDSGSFMLKKVEQLPEERVCISYELKFNLFSVSQMCDKKNSVLFTESECLILSPSFKLLDESQVVLRALRKDDVYSLDLKNIKFPLEYNLSLVLGLPSKVFVNDHTCVACKKVKQHKASCSSGKDKEPTQEYILLPLQPHRTRILVEDDALMTKDEQVLHDDLEKMIAQEVVAKALDDATRQAFEEEKRNIASQIEQLKSTSITKLSTG